MLCGILGIIFLICKYIKHDSAVLSVVTVSRGVVRGVVMGVVRGVVVL